MPRSKSNRTFPGPRPYSSLSKFEQAAVKVAMVGYNQQYLDRPYFEVEEFYTEVYSKSGWFA
ncbi:hypothetical protein [Methanosarcina acetivorans]|uniref:hypothetical protein n=1 Tax=Methanosarcina acetivorans TaxID=2214 RepID=UPI00064FBFEC|nr:hypothetical protein [Methanosarcina acetivorans]